MPAVWSVALLSPPFNTLNYAAPERLGGLLHAGQRVLVPLGRSALFRTGVLLGPSSDGSWPAGAALKEIFWPLESKPFFEHGYMDMIEQLARRHMWSPGQILASVLPQSLRRGKVVFFFPQANRLVKVADFAAFAPDKLDEAAQLWADGRMLAVSSEKQARSMDVWQVSKDPPWPIRPQAKRQMEVMEFLWQRRVAGRAEIERHFGAVGLPVLKRLEEWGLIARTTLAQTDKGPEEHAPLGTPPFTLSAEQAMAVEELHKGLCAENGQSRLLFGITGSGKSIVYLELARRALEAGKLVFILAPEVALAKHLYEQAGAYLPGREMLMHHGYLPPGRKEDNFLKMAARRRGQPLLVIGTRSAIFLPGPPPDLLVLDEEHDTSFKQDERLTYQVKEVAHFRISQSGGLLVLGSATPDVKSYYASRHGLLERVSMNRRLGSAGLPVIRLIDIKALRPNEHILAAETLEKLTSTLENGDQAMILLNRRGYASMLFCLDCGVTERCPNCDISLTYHKGRERLLCHYCGRSEAFPRPCKNCGGVNFLPMGEGTQKLEENLSALLPRGTEILRLDRDSVRRSGRMEEILGDFAAHKAQVLVGTQMLSKGHHFPRVTLVIVADADVGLNLPDYRATERTFQLMVQAAGRAGRGERPGEVYVQTRLPGHFCWEFVTRQDYEGFYQREIEIRKRRSYPPFVKLGLIRIQFALKDEEKGLKDLAEIGRILRQAGLRAGVKVMGPAPAPLVMLQGRKRFQCLIKAPDWVAIRSLYRLVLQKLPSSSPLSLGLDLDPGNLL